MAVDSGKPLMAWETAPEVVEEITLTDMMDDAIDDFMAGDSYEVVLEDELVHEYDFQTLFKATHFEEYSSRYNHACTAMAKAGDKEGVQALVEIRFEARRHGMNNMPLILEVSPYTDEGAALCYGYVEGCLEHMKEMDQRREAQRNIFIKDMPDGSKMAYPAGKV